AARETEASHDFVKNQNGFGTFRHVAQEFQKAGARRNTSHITDNRFDDDARNFFPSAIEFRLQGVRVVERKNRSQLGETLRYTGTIRQAKRGDAGARFHKKTVAVSVIAAVEFHNTLASGESTREPDGAHCRFGPGIDETNLFNRWNKLCDEL